MAGSGRGLGLLRRAFSGRHAIVVAVLATLLTAALAWRSHEAFPRDGFLFLYMPIIGAVAYFGGPWPGLAAVCVSLITARFFVIPPAYTLTVSGQTLPILSLFALIAMLVVDGAVRLRNAEMASYRFALLVDSADDAILSKSLDGIIQTWNPAAERLYGYTAAEAVGHPITMLSPSDRLTEISEIMVRLRQGAHIEHFETVRQRKDGTRVDVSISWSPITDVEGRIIGTSSIARDITGPKRAERQQRALLDVSEALASPRSVQAVTDALARLVVPAFADWCTVLLKETDGTLHLASVVHHDPSRASLVREILEHVPRPHPDKSGSVLERGQSRLFPVVSDDLLAGFVPDTRLRDIVRRLGLRSMVIAPIKIGERVLGAVSLVSGDSPHRYDERDVRFSEQLSDYAALAIENARLHQVEQTQRRTAEETAEWVRRLLAVATALSEALSPSDVADVILIQGIGAVDAQAGAVYVIGGDGDSLETLGYRGYPDDLMKQRGATSLSAPFPVVDCVTTGEAVYAEAADRLVDRYPALRGRMHPHPGARVYLPLAVAGRTIGALALVFQATRTFDGAQREFMQVLARQCAQALERARLYAREHQVANTLQHALLPSAFPKIPGIRIDGVYRSGARDVDIGGDWYDAFTLPGGRLVLTVGDVAGRGLDAAVLMGEMRHAIRTAALAGHDPAKVLQVANSVARGGVGGMVTAVVIMLDPTTLHCTYAAAGHPAPILATRRGIETLAQGTFPLGMRDGLPAVAESFRLPSEAVLVLYTDGLTEFERDPITGEAALRSAVLEVYPARFDNLATRIVDRVVGDHRALDDIAVLVIAVESGMDP